MSTALVSNWWPTELHTTPSATILEESTENTIETIKAHRSKEQKAIIFCFPSARDAWPLLGKQGLNICGCCSGRQVFSFLSFYWEVWPCMVCSISLVFELAAMVISPLHPLRIPADCLWRGLEKAWCCASTAQQWTKHQCDINTVLPTTAGQGSVWAPVVKINSIPGRHRHQHDAS